MRGRAVRCLSVESKCLSPAGGTVWKAGIASVLIDHIPEIQQLRQLESSTEDLVDMCAVLFLCYKVPNGKYKMPRY